MQRGRSGNFCAVEPTPGSSARLECATREAALAYLG